MTIRVSVVLAGILAKSWRLAATKGLAADHPQEMLMARKTFHRRYAT